MRPRTPNLAPTAPFASRGCTSETRLGTERWHGWRQGDGSTYALLARLTRPEAGGDSIFHTRSDGGSRWRRLAKRRSAILTRRGVLESAEYPNPEPISRAAIHRTASRDWPIKRQTSSKIGSGLENKASEQLIITRILALWWFICSPSPLIMLMRHTVLISSTTVPKPVPTLPNRPSLLFSSLYEATIFQTATV